MRHDDALVGESAQPGPKIILADAGHHVHELPESWLRSRVRGWLELNESPGLPYWIGTYTAEGKWIYCSSEQDRWAPQPFRQEYAMAVCKHVNLQAANGGAWLVGWIRGGREFYLLWKDEDGDIQIPIECDKPFVVLMGYTVYNWENLCNEAFGVYCEAKRALEMTKDQQVKRAQGQRMSAEHHSAAPPIVMP